MVKCDVREALRQAIDEEMTRDARVFLLGEEVGEYNGAYKVSKGLLDKWGPKRILDTPISELGFSGLGIGAAMTGLRPIVEFMSFNFCFVAIDQIISNAAKMYYMSGGRFSVPIVFRGPNGAAAQVSSQHSHCVEALFANLPGLIVMAPSNAYNAKGLLKSAIRCDDPVLFLESELSYSDAMDIPEEEYVVPIGVARQVREGSDITIVTYSRMVKVSEEAALKAEEQGVSCEIIDLQTIKPLDMEAILASVRKTHRLLIVEEGHDFASIASEITFRVQKEAFDELDAPIGRVCQLRTPMPYSKVLEAETVPNTHRVLKAILETVR